MGRSLKDIRLQDRASRAQLRPRNHPYWRGISTGFHLGYYRGKRVGTWVARYTKPETAGGYVTEVLGHADDVTGAEGSGNLSWAQALEKALDWVRLQQSDNPAADPKITVKHAIELYIGVRDARDSEQAGGRERR